MRIMFYMNLIFIVIAVSVDGFGVGMTYGMRKIQISLPALIVIMLASGGLVTTSMVLGHGLRMVITLTMTSMIGSFILISLGIFVFFSTIRSNKSNGEEENLPGNIESTSHISHFKSVLADPHRADKDQSGSISIGEALVLGTALALDAFGA